jgi:hypothetical protein
MENENDKSPTVVVAIKQLQGDAFVSDAPERMRYLNMIGSNVVMQAYIEVCTMRHPQLSSHPSILKLLGIAEYSGADYLSDRTVSLVTEYADMGFGSPKI